MDYQPKISITEAFLVGSLVVASDLFGIILFFTAFDDYFILDVIMITITQSFFWFKRVNSTSDLIMNLFEIPPGLGVVPWRSFGFFRTVYTDRNPESFITKGMDAANKLASKVPIPKKKGPKIPVKKAA